MASKSTGVARMATASRVCERAALRASTGVARLRFLRDLMNCGVLASSASRSNRSPWTTGPYSGRKSAKSTVDSASKKLIEWKCE
ncbi:hypothetical protein D3C71_1781470 [compost metagenome]